MNEYRIDPDLNKVLPDLSEEDYKALEQSLLTDGYKGAPIMIWGDIIVDGHNRYEICQKHNIPYEVKSVEFENKEEVILWMARQQLGRRNLTPMQRIKIVEEYRPYYTKKAKENQSRAGKEYGNGAKKLLQNSSKATNGESESQNPSTPNLLKDKINVRAELAKDANVSTDTYSKGLKILQSEDSGLINQTMSGEKSINKAYKELTEQQKTKQYETELADLKSNGRKEAAQRIKEAREDGGVSDNAEYEKAKEEQANVEKRIVELEGMINGSKNDKVESKTMSNDDATKLSQIRENYIKYLETFQNDIDWLTAKEFVKEEEDVTGKIRSDLQNCFEKFKSIEQMIKKMQIADWDESTVIVD